jgi:hypothetical protein
VIPQGRSNKATDSGSGRAGFRLVIIGSATHAYQELQTATHESTLHSKGDRRWSHPKLHRRRRGSGFRCTPFRSPPLADYDVQPGCASLGACRATIRRRPPRRNTKHPKKPETRCVTRQGQPRPLCGPPAATSSGPAGAKPEGPRRRLRPGQVPLGYSCVLPPESPNFTNVPSVRRAGWARPGTLHGEEKLAGAEAVSQEEPAPRTPGRHPATKRVGKSDSHGPCVTALVPARRCLGLFSSWPCRSGGNRESQSVILPQKVLCSPTPCLS